MADPDAPSWLNPPAPRQPQAKAPSWMQPARGRYGDGIEAEALRVDPSLRVSGRGRTAERNKQVGGVPNSRHLSDNARDFVPVGEDLGAAERRLQQAMGPRGYKVILEGAGARHSTAPHIHIEPTDGAQDFAPPSAPSWMNQQPASAPQQPKPQGGTWYGEGRPRRQAKPQAPSWLDRAKSLGREALEANPISAAYMHAGDIGNLASRMAQSVNPFSDDAAKRRQASAQERGDKQRQHPIRSIVQQAAETNPIVSGYLHGPQALLRQGKQAADTLRQDFTAPVGGEPGAARNRVLKTGSDIAGAVSTPLTAAMTGAVGEPAQQLGIDRDAAGNLASMFVGGGAASKAGIIPSAEGLAKGGAAERVRSGYRATAGAFSPTAASTEAKATGLFIRKARGVNQRVADQAAARLDRIDKRFNRATPEQHDAFYAFMEGRGKAPETGKPGVIVKGEEVGGGEYDWARDLGMSSRDIADANEFRRTFKQYEGMAAKAVKANTGALPKFIEDYYPHMWEQPEAEVQSRMAEWLTRQGSGRNLRKREIPTIADGIAAGLKPRYGPVQTAQIYAENMSRFVTTNEVQAFMKQNGHAVWYRPGRQPEGWQPLDGILTERKPKLTGGGRKAKDRFTPGDKGPLRLGGPEAPKLPGPGERPALGHEPPVVDEPAQIGSAGAVALAGERRGPGSLGAEERPAIEDINGKLRNATPEPRKEPEAANVGDRRVDKEVLYAPPSVARLYNNYISKGFDPAKGPLQAIGHYAYRVGVHDMIWKFGLSAYHASTMALESIASSMSTAVQEASRGRAGSALKAALSAPVRPAVNLYEGNKLRNVMLGRAEGSPFQQKLADAFAKGGGTLKMDRDYRGTAAKSFYGSLKSGTFRRDLKAAVAKTYARDATGYAKAKAAAEVVSNVLTSISGPLFEDVIPRMKMGAWSQNMEAFLKANPRASEAEIEAYAGKALDSMDNRFGEMSRDNMFWDKQTHEALQAVMLSPTWNIGSMREILGGIHDLPESVKGVLTGKGVTNRTAYLAGMGVTVALLNGIMTYLKTGEAPQGQDFLAYRTGGTDARTDSPERGLFPGNQKEVYALIDAMQSGSGGLPHYAYGKLNDQAGMAADLSANSDYKGDDIYGPGAAEGATADYFKGRALPISVNTAEQGSMTGSNIGAAEKVFGARAAPLYLTDPDAVALMRENRTTKAKAAAERRAARRKGRYQ